MGKRKAWILNLGLTLGSVLFGVFIGEIGLRLAGIEGLKKLPQPGHGNFSPSFYTMSHPDLGWVNRPGASGIWEQEGKAYIEINIEGLRDNIHPKTKAKDAVRIAVLGDSFTLAVQVDVKQTYWSVIENELKSCQGLKGKTVEVMNFGVDGYGTAQELLMLREKVWDYNPDIVILSFFIGNDIIDNSPGLESNHYRPFFVYKDGELVPDYSFRNLSLEHSDRYWITTVDRLPMWLVNHSRILQVAKKAERDLKQKNLLLHLNKLTAKNFREPTDPVWQEAWKVTEDLITMMNQEVNQNNAEFLLVTIADPIQVHPNPAFRQSFMNNYQIEDLSYPEKRLQTLGNNQGFPVLNLAEPFQTYSEQNQVCLHGFETAVPCAGHWNPDGHEFAGKLIANQLCQQVKK
ncbi:MAG: SGNH/GDSL hydrolase family protein [Limnoraphis robusta]|uniref:SGNH/GDSL hydrolase family protein n=1 Tax=Limnoraphis robusta TaxID=1118279 RepID=UPI002B20B45E|nr:SGNH/GDSL hydrolase family protein [Limnoraphis robusta]MEA5500655.1 SGNH/GDSL hydrolase family protein [Limnoraphis robusta BA-68 BA1]MEA5541515.1 SGNH/GDSL hydrolase family protein [Limnoraphis robusta Tam1]